MKYKCEYVKTHYDGMHSHNADMLEIAINERAQQGWKLHSMVQVEGAVYWLVVFKRGDGASRAYPRNI